VQITCEVLELPTRHEFRIAREGARVRRSVWMRLRGEDGLEGWGESAATPFYGESADTVVALVPAIADVLSGEDAPESFEDIVAIESRIERAVGYSPAARAGVSAALHDLLGRRWGKPLWRMLDLDPSLAPKSSFTIGIDDPEVMRAKVREAATYPILKLKVGTARDEEVLSIVRDEAPHARIRVDANTGWSVGEALDNLPMLVDFGVELIEQPVAADDYDGLAEVRRASAIPIIADESCKVVADIARLVGCVDGVNIKLAKCGSLQEALRLVEAARAHDMQIMLGCMVETTLGISAALQLAPLLDYADLDGAALLAADPFRGGGLEPDGSLRFNTGPGLGVTLAR
jgi:L-alanine-DL-glutamate epimerase-like enolase superfamily enzyme